MVDQKLGKYAFRSNNYQRPTQSSVDRDTHTQHKLVLILTLTCLYVADDSKSSNRMTHTLTEKKAAIVKEKKKKFFGQKRPKKKLFSLCCLKMENE